VPDPGGDVQLRRQGLLLGVHDERPDDHLKKDHAEAKKVLTELGKSEPGKARHDMVAKVTAALELHMSIEEALVYPLVKKAEGADVTHEADVEHGLAREGIATMNNMIDEPGFGAAAESLLGGILHHVREEETEILPALKAKLSTTDWAALGDEVAAAHTAGAVPVRP
jgi:hemerythrin-like domain-containing protein